MKYILKISLLFLFIFLLFYPPYKSFINIQPKNNIEFYEIHSGDTVNDVLYDSVNELLKINSSPADFSNSRRNLVLKIIINKPITFKKSINLSLDTDVLLASLITFLKLLKLGKNKFITCFTIYILHAL